MLSMFSRTPWRTATPGVDVSLGFGGGGGAGVPLAMVNFIAFLSGLLSFDRSDRRLVNDLIEPQTDQRGRHEVEDVGDGAPARDGRPSSVTETDGLQHLHQHQGIG